MEKALKVSLLPTLYSTEQIRAFQLDPGTSLYGLVQSFLKYFSKKVEVAGGASHAECWPRSEVQLFCQCFEAMLDSKCISFTFTLLHDNSMTPYRYPLFIIFFYSLDFPSVLPPT